MQPYFSIVMPVYNVEKYLGRSIESVLNQSFTDFEVILVDDGSTDRSPAMCDEFAQKHLQISVIHQENGGLSSARNAGLKKANGKYVWWVDSDDWIAEDALQILHAATLQTQPEVVKFNHYRVADEVHKIASNADKGCFEQPVELMHQWKKAFISAGKYILSAWSHLYSREWLVRSQIDFCSERIVGSEDYLFNLQLIPFVRKMLVIEDALYYYEKREGSLTQKYRPNLPLQYTQLFRQLMHKYQEKHVREDLLEPAACFYVWHLMLGTCVSHEYHRLNEHHSLRDARKNVRSVLQIPELQQAVNTVMRTAMPFKKRIQLIAIKMQLEPLFYWLYIVKAKVQAFYRR